MYSKIIFQNFREGFFGVINLYSIEQSQMSDDVNLKHGEGKVLVSGFFPGHGIGLL